MIIHLSDSRAGRRPLAQDDRLEATRNGDPDHTPIQIQKKLPFNFHKVARRQQFETFRTV